MTKIEWVRGGDGELGQTWNPIVGCSIVSPGCTNCYAMKQAHRIQLMAAESKGNVPSHYAGTTKLVKGIPVWTGKVAMAPDSIFLKPLRRRIPTTYFVNSMSDLFHEDVPDEWIDRVLSVAIRANWHTYQILTKRSARMRSYMTEVRDSGRWLTWTWEDGGLIFDPACAQFAGAFRHLWLGVSAEDQKRADERIPDLLATPAAVRFVSAEPLLGAIDFRSLACVNACPPPTSCRKCSEDGGLGHADELLHGLHWIIVGGESGNGARPFDLVWARSIRDQCATAGVACFVKQLGSQPVDSSLCIEGDAPSAFCKDRKGGDPSEWPLDLRVREMPCAQEAVPA